MMVCHRYTKRTRFCSLVAILLSVLLFCGCSKDESPDTVEDIDRSRIGYIIEDNFNLSVCQKILLFTDQSRVLKSDTTYTFLAPDNAAFTLLTLPGAPFYQYEDSWFTKIMRNAMLPGSHRFNEMPLGDNQPVTCMSGHKVYVSKYKVGNDTITRVNGAKLEYVDVKASNGLLQVTSQVIQPELSNELAQFLRIDTSFTLFALALQHSGLMPSLKSGEYTVLMPLNQILRAKGTILPGVNLSTPENILSADPAALAALLKYHLLPGRIFLDRFHRLAEASGDGSVTTINGEKIKIGGNADTYNSTTFLGNQNSSPAGIHRNWSEAYNFANIPFGNGVVHGINQVLLP